MFYIINNSFVSFLSLSLFSLTTGGLFTEEEKAGPEELAFKYAIYRINKDRSLVPNTTFVYDIQYIAKDDSFHGWEKR